MNDTMKNPAIFDNGGKTYDRFTIINRRSGDMFGASENPTHPAGFGQFTGNIRQDWNKPIHTMLEAYRADPDWIGVEIEITNAPKEVQEWVKGL